MLAPRFLRTLAAATLGLIASAALASAQAPRLDVIYVPTPAETVDRMLTLATVGPNDFVIDLGCGDGRIAIGAAALGARALGVDIDPARIREAKANAAAAGLTDKVTFREQNLFETALSDATVLTLYLLPELNLKLRPKILALKPGTRVVSHRFDMGDWKPDHSEEIARLVHFWVVPARVAGRWQMRAGEQNFTLTLQQQFQDFSGTATIAGGVTPVRNARLRGPDIEFTVDIAGTPTAFRGKVDGNKISGKTESGEWQANKS